MLTVGEPLKKRKKLEMLFSTTEFLEIARFCFPEQQFILEQMGDPFPESFWEEIFDSLHDYKPKLSFFTRLLGGNQSFFLSTQINKNKSQFNFLSFKNNMLI